MHKILAVQIAILILVSGALGGMLVFTDVYDDVESAIVTRTCFSCIKMNPVSRLEFTFKTVDNQPHPDFVLNNLTDGPVFLVFGEDGCKACEKTNLILKDIFNVEFGEQELFYQTVEYSGKNISFFHINLDHSSDEMIKPFYVYDKDHCSGVPMFVIITVGNNSGEIQPYYTTAYATVSEAFFRKMISEGIDFYNKNRAGYIQD